MVYRGILQSTTVCTMVYSNSIKFCGEIASSSGHLVDMPQQLMVYKFNPPQSSVLSFIFNKILIYMLQIVIKELYLKK